MQSTAYEGYFSNGRFYTSGKEVQIPEQRRVIITVLNDLQTPDSENSRKKEILRNLRGSCKDSTMNEPPEVPLEHGIYRNYGLI